MFKCEESELSSDGSDKEERAAERAEKEKKLVEEMKKRKVRKEEKSDDDEDSDVDLDETKIVDIAEEYLAAAFPQKISTNFVFTKVNQLGNFFDLRPVKNWDTYMKMENSEFLKRYRFKPFNNTYTKKDFQFLKSYGRSMFSECLLAKNRKTKLYYGIKCYKKKTILQLEIGKLVENEMKLLNAIRSPFIEHASYFFEDSKRQFFTIPLSLGGTVFGLLKRHYRLTEYYCKFIAAQVVLAIEYLHNMEIIYRNLKPENMLIDHHGFIKLADLSISKKLEDTTRTFTLCGGTIEYLAPEMLTTSGYDKSVDYWAIGILIYELYTGITPFYNEDELLVYKNILEGNYHNHFTFSSTLINLIKSLLKSTPNGRLGNLEDGINDIKNHYWFKDILWLPLFNKAVIPPYVPEITEPHDMCFYEGLDNEDSELNESCELK